MTVATGKEALAKALGKVTSGIYIVTTGQGDQKQGFLASWIMQAGFDPPTLTVAVGKDREILNTLQVNDQFVVNILSEENMDLLKRFAQYKPGQFESLDLEETAAGAILKDTVAYLAAHVLDVYPGQDHRIILAQVDQGEVLSETLHPWAHLRKNGFVY